MILSLNSLLKLNRFYPFLYYIILITNVNLPLNPSRGGSLTPLFENLCCLQLQQKSNVKVLFFLNSNLRLKLDQR